MTRSHHPVVEAPPVEASLLLKVRSIACGVGSGAEQRVAAGRRQVNQEANEGLSTGPPMCIAIHSLATVPAKGMLLRE